MKINNIAEVLSITEIEKIEDRGLSIYLSGLVKSDLEGYRLRYALKITEHDFLLIMENILCSPWMHVNHISRRLLRLGRENLCSSLKLESINWEVSNEEIRVGIFYQNLETDLIEAMHWTITRVEKNIHPQYVLTGG